MRAKDGGWLSGPAEEQDTVATEISNLLHHLTTAVSAAQPTSLHGALYTSESFFQHERLSTLAQGWHCLGRADEIPMPGDFLTATILDEPLIAVRGTDEQIRVLSNLCRHRNMPLVQGRGQTKRFLCPYHAWSYRLDGRLLRAPHMDQESFAPETCRLPEFQSTVWNGFLWIRLDDPAAPFETGLEDLNTLISPFEPGRYEIVHAEEEIWRCNWKSLVENFMEGYHLSVVPQTKLRGCAPAELSRTGPSGPAFTSYIANYPESIASRGQGAPGLSDHQRHSSTLFCVYPGMVASISANLLVALMLRPIDPDQVLVRWTMSIYPEECDDDLIAQRIALWQEVNREDREKLELMQKGFRSRHAIAGPLAGDDLEGTIHDFHQYLARKLSVSDPALQ
ncbi:MAG: aromatic ring-hydroxylating dioxygenase subunit alpha [Paracoccaceae bacterium]